MQKNSQETRIALLEQSQLYIIDTLKEIKTEIKEFRIEIKQDIENFRKDTNERFKKIDERFIKIDERFEKINERFDKIMHWLVGTIGFGIFTILANFALRYFFNI